MNKTELKIRNTLLKLERDGAIDSYTADLLAEQLGVDLTSRKASIEGYLDWSEKGDDALLYDKPERKQHYIRTRVPLYPVLNEMFTEDWKDKKVKLTLEEVLD